MALAMGLMGRWTIRVRFRGPCTKWKDGEL